MPVFWKDRRVDPGLAVCKQKPFCIGGAGRACVDERDSVPAGIVAHLSIRQQLARVKPQWSAA